MLTYRPGDSLAHRLDPRTKLALQAAFVAGAFADLAPARLAALTVVAAFGLRSAHLSPVRVLGAYRAFLPFLLLGPAVAALTLGPPWVAPAEAVGPALASYRVLLVFLVAGAYVRTTPVRDSRAAVQWAVPGRAGRVLGAGVGLVVRFFPLLRRDVLTAREAMRARLGSRRPLRERMRLVATAGLVRAFGRADRLALALRARCFAWNPTLPALRFGRADAPALALAAGLAASALV